MYQSILNFRQNDRVIFEWGVGGDDKMNSSSWILNEFYFNLIFMLNDERYNFIWRLSSSDKIENRNVIISPTRTLNLKNFYYIKSLMNRQVT